MAKSTLKEKIGYGFGDMSSSMFWKMMGIISDRTQTKWGKYRPYLLWVAPFFSICGILLFTTPDLDYAGKLIWAYVTYILMMTVYTGINVPYGAMLGVMTDDSNEKTVFSSFRMFFAYGGSFISLFLWEPLTNLMGGYSTPGGWFWAMVVISAACFVMFLLCFTGGLFLPRHHWSECQSGVLRVNVRLLCRFVPWRG